MNQQAKPITNADTRKKCVDHVNEFAKRVSKGRQMPERMWFSSILMQRGYHWISFENTRGTFVKANNRRSIPRPVTNKYAECGTTLVSNLINFDPRSTYAPQTGNMDDMHAAISANQIIKSIENEIGWQEIKAEAYPWLVYTGNVFLLYGYDKDGGKIKEVRDIVCLNSQYGGQCQYKETVGLDEDTSELKCPTCGESGIDAPMVESPENAKKEQPETQAAGCMTCEVVNPFEMFFDYSLGNFDKSTTVVRIMSKSQQWVKDNYGKDVPTASVHRQELNARFRAGLTNLVPTGEEAPVDQVDVVEAWVKPGKKFKKGFHLLMLADGQILELSTYPWITKEGKCFIPIVHLIYERTPGAAYGRTPMFDAMEKQRMRNRVEALGEMFLTRMSNPVWLIPRGTETENISGHIGQEIHFDATQTNGQAPHRDKAPDMPPAFVLWIDRMDNEMYKLLGIPEITRGERPLSIKTGFGMEKLEQAAKARSSPVFMNITIASSKIQMVELEIFRMQNPPDRYMRVFGKAAGWTVQKIQSVDLDGGVDIWVEPGGTQPKTPLERQAQLDLFIQAGLLNVQDPMVAWRIFMLYGMEDLQPELDADLLQIAREQDRFTNNMQPAVGPDGQPVVDPQTGQPMYQPTLRMNPWDNHMLHHSQHSQLMKGEAFEAMPPGKQMEMLQHDAMHVEQIQLAMAAQAQQQQQEQKPAGGPPEKGGPQ